VEPAQLPASHGITRRLECGIESAGIADLHRQPGRFHVPLHADGLFGTARDRFLAEDRQPGVHGGADQGRMGVSRRCDEHAVDTCRQQLLG
jgi:hypothetical protein